MKTKTCCFTLLSLILFTMISIAQEAKKPLPIIDVHMHASRIVPGAMLNNVYAPKTQEEYEKQVLALLDKYNIHAYPSGDDSVLAYWKMKSRERILPSRMVWSPQQINISELKKELISKKWMAIGEVCSQYQGLAPNDTCLEKIYALAEETNTPL